MSEPKWTVSRHPRNIILKGEMYEDGEQAKHDAAVDSAKRATFEFHLNYEGSCVHVLAGPNAERALNEQAEAFNAKNYEPKMVKGKLYPELTQKQREKLAYKSSPELPLA